MRVVVQRVTSAKVVINKEVAGKIKDGLLLLVGFTEGDSAARVDYMIKKIVNLRIFPDDEGKMNKSVIDINGEILSISQFTLYGSVEEGNRPSFTRALSAPLASILYDTFNERLSELIHVEKGIFGSDMKVTLTNDGPVTIIINSKGEIK